MIISIECCLKITLTTIITTKIETLFSLYRRPYQRSNSAIHKAGNRERERSLTAVPIQGLWRLSRIVPGEAVKPWARGFVNHAVTARFTKPWNPWLERSWETVPIHGLWDVSGIRPGKAMKPWARGFVNHAVRPKPWFSGSIPGNHESAALWIALYVDLVYPL